jgi:hypothetical protein
MVTVCKFLLGLTRWNMFNNDKLYKHGIDNVKMLHYMYMHASVFLTIRNLDHCFEFVHKPKT